MARTDQKAQVAPPGDFDIQQGLKNFAAVIQRNLEDLFDLAHSHRVTKTVPKSSDGVTQDIWLYDDGTHQYLYVKFPSGWKRFVQG